MNKYEKEQLIRRIEYLESKQLDQIEANRAMRSKIRALAYHLDVELMMSDEGFRYYRAIPNKILDTVSEE